MSEQTRAAKPARADETTAEVKDTGATQRAESEKVKADADALLDEIDQLLADQGLDEEAQAEAFVSQYHQRGGE